VLPPATGALIATPFDNPAGDFPHNLVATAPSWYAVLLLPYAVLGTLAFAGKTVYSAGLDLDASFRRLSRPVATGSSALPPSCWWSPASWCGRP
jgi:hypothetical protein